MAHRFAVQGDHPVAHRRQHPFDLVVAAFADGQQQFRVAQRPRLGGPGGRRVVVQHHPVAQPRQLGVVQRLGGGHPVALGAVVTRRHQAVGPLAVGGEQQQTGGVPVQAADDAQTTALLGGNQIDHRGQGVLQGAHPAGRFVQHQVALAGQRQHGTVEPHALPRRHAAVGLEAGARRPVFTGHRHRAAADQRLGLLAAEAGGVGDEEIQPRRAGGRISQAADLLRWE